MYRTFLFFEAVVLACLTFACQQSSETGSESRPVQDQPPDEPERNQEEEGEGGGQAFVGVTPPRVDQTEVPGPNGPFVEPPLLERPREIHYVVVERSPTLDAADAIRAAVAKIQAVPIGYPAIDQASSALGSKDGWAVVAGKFARKEYAQALADVLRKKGQGKTLVVSRPYRHDRFSPAANLDSGNKAARVFAGMAGMEVPLLSRPEREAPGTGIMLPDGKVVEVIAKEETDQGFWYRVQSKDATGFLPASRLLVETNVFPSPNARRAILAVSIGCGDNTCRWDYWLVGRDYAPRRLIGPASERLLHDFSLDGRVVAFASPGRNMTLVFEEGHADVDLGPGTSPSFSSDSKQVYFRRPGISKMRDDVMVARAPEWKAETFFDFKGEPIYPRSLSAYPPRVDLLENGTKLYTMFYRLVRKDGGMVIHRWKVLLTQEGKLISKKGEQLTD